MSGVLAFFVLMLLAALADSDDQIWEKNNELKQK
jgi:hypothetical protein